jgi:hypothetical protein
MYYEIIGTQVRLAGSLHRLPVGSPGMPDRIWRAYEWSEELMFEADATDALKYFFSIGPSLKTKIPGVRRRAGSHGGGEFRRLHGTLHR